MNQNLVNKLKLAQNFSTSANTLKELAESTQELKVLQAIASNPNCPPIILKEFFFLENSTLSLAVLNNPALELILIENPLFLEELADIDPDFFSTEKIPEHILKLWKPSPHKNLTIRLASNKYLPLLYMEKLAISDLSEIRYWLASNENLSLAICQKLAKDSSKAVRKKLAENKEVCPEILEFLAKDKEAAVLQHLSGNPNLPVHYFQPLVYSQNYFIRAKIAVNISTPIWLLEKLVNDSNLFVITMLLLNPRSEEIDLRKKIFQSLSFERLNNWFVDPDLDLYPHLYQIATDRAKRRGFILNYLDGKVKSIEKPFFPIICLEILQKIIQKISNKILKKYER